MKTVTLPDSTTLPAIGQGTWHMGRDLNRLRDEADALRRGIDLGLTVIDTAEMYDDAELVVADAIKGQRDDVFVVSKVLPSNASKSKTMLACERSLNRLGVDCIDLYLLHWPGKYPLEDTLEAFENLVDQGKIARYGVSNFDTSAMNSAWQLPGGNKIATNQVLYNLQSRGIEWDLLPWCRKHDLPIMAYCPINQGKLAPDALEQVAIRHNVSRFQIALAWLLHDSGVMAIPKSSNPDHVEKNRLAMDIELTDEDIKVISAVFPAPNESTPLDIV